MSSIPPSARRSMMALAALAASGSVIVTVPRQVANPLNSEKAHIRSLERRLRSGK